MLGEQIGEFRGKIMGQRVLCPDGPNPKMEAWTHDYGKILGIDAEHTTTYTSTVWGPRLFHADAYGVITTKDGDTVTCIGGALGKYTGKGGAVNSRGAIYFQTTASKLARLSSVVGILEAAADENGNTSVKIWEWK